MREHCLPRQKLKIGTTKIVFLEYPSEVGFNDVFNNERLMYEVGMCPNSCSGRYSPYYIMYYRGALCPPEGTSHAVVVLLRNQRRTTTGKTAAVMKGVKGSEGQVRGRS